MDEQAFRFDITPAEASQLEALQRAFDPDMLSRAHDKRYEVQKQWEGIYLIAWHEHTPIGQGRLLPRKKEASSCFAFKKTCVETFKG